MESPPNTKAEAASPALSAISPAPAKSATPEANATIESPNTSPATSSKKRSNSDTSMQDEQKQPKVKRQKTLSPPKEEKIVDVAEDVDMVDTPTKSIAERITAQPYTEPLFDDEPMHLLERSIALALKHVGFDGATKQAMESFKAQANSFAEHFLSNAVEAMRASRRVQPIPLDFEYALRKEGLTDHLLRPHLKPPVSKENCEVQMELEPAKKPKWSVPPALLGAELSGEADKLTKSYIPKHFPAFPSKHTYKATEVMPQRESDPRKIREKATEAARHGEEALRRLVGIGKSSDQKVAKKMKSQDKRTKHELWERTMADLLSMNDSAKKDGLAQGVMIDAGKKYYRHPTTRMGN